MLKLGYGLAIALFILMELTDSTTTLVEKLSLFLIWTGKLISQRDLVQLFYNRKIVIMTDISCS